MQGASGITRKIMAEYKTPGVYIEEISTFPTSVVRVATAVPVFVGYTEIANAAVLNIPTKIKSLIDYEQLYGGEPTTVGRTLTVHLDAGHAVSSVDVGLTYYLYQSLRHFYANGGGDAYILSVGNYDGSPDKAELVAALALLEKVDEPTLVLVPDAYHFNAADLGLVQSSILAHCNKMQDRFGVFDVLDTGDADADALAYRGAVGTQNLKYGAAYYPALNTSIGPNGAIALSGFALKDSLDAPTTLATVAAPAQANDPTLLAWTKLQADKDSLANTKDAAHGNKSWATLLNDWTAAYAAAQAPIANDGAGRTVLINLTTTLAQMAWVIYAMKPAPYFTNAALDLARDNIVKAAGTLKGPVRSLFQLHLSYDAVTVTSLAAPTVTLGVMVVGDFASPSYALGTVTVPGTNPFTASGVDPATVAAAVTNSLAAYKSVYDALVSIYNGLVAVADAEIALLGDLTQTSKVVANIISSIRSTGYKLPPSGAIAGIYATVDANRGVWKAPANVGLTAVSSVAKLSDDQLDKLNVDATAGKSINAIRFFRGQGILVYGARTLAGNDNEWRYVPVRRLFIMVEESVKKASEPFVFEPNDANTWQRVKGMIENFLIGIWRDGALAGAVPKDAFFVKVGLGQTMTAQDILEGKMIIEIGMAAVRPAEFIILKFSHKLQVS